MSQWVYIPTDGGSLHTVGFYDPEGKWQPESDHASQLLAAQRCAYLNGSINCGMIANRLHKLANSWSKLNGLHSRTIREIAQTFQQLGEENNGR